MQMSIAGQPVTYESLKVTSGNVAGLPSLNSVHEVEADDLYKSEWNIMYFFITIYIFP